MSMKTTKSQSRVLWLYEASTASPVVIPDGAEPGSGTGNSHEGRLNTIRGCHNCHRHLLETHYTQVGPATERKFIDDESCYFGENGGVLSGKRFSLRTSGHKKWRENRHFVRVREQDPDSSLELPKDGDICHKWHNGITTCGSPIFDIEIRGDHEDTVETKINLTISVDPNREHDTEFIVIQQDKAISHWNDITSKCAMDKNTFNDSVHITIPIEKTSRVWVVRIKRSLNHLVDVLLVLLCGQVLFRILMFCKVQHEEVNLRIIGINEEQQVCPAAQVFSEAKESGFQMIEASNAKQLIKKGKLLVSFNLSGNCIKSDYFNLDGAKVSKFFQQVDFKCTIADLECIPRVEVQTADASEEVLWLYDVKNMIKMHAKHVEQPRKPALASLDDKVKDEDIRWLAHQVNKDWEKLGVCLDVTLVELEIIKENTKHDVVDRCLSMLYLWQEKKRESSTWRSLQEALEKPVVRRLDIFRHLQLEDEIISDLMLLELAYKVGRSWKMFGLCLNIPAEVIEIIDLDITDVVEKGMSLLQKWRQGENPSMEELKKALCDPLMKRYDLAKGLENSCRV